MKNLTLCLLLLSPLGAAAGVPMSLADAIARADTAALAVALSADDVAAAAAMSRRARAGHLPSVSLQQDWVRGDDPVAAFGTRLRQERFTAADFAVDRLNRPDPVTDARAVLEVRQPLFTSGRSLYGRRAARAAQAAAGAAQRRTREAVALQTSQAYWSLVLSTGALEVAEAALAAARQHADDAEAAWRAGAITRGDRLAADLRIAELEAGRIDAAARVRQAADGLTLVLDLPAGTEVIATDSLEGNAAAAAVVDVDRADLQARRFQAAAAGQQARAERAATRPQIGAFAQVAADARTPFGADGTSWMAGAVLRWDLFSGFAGRGAADAADARAHRAETEVRQLQAAVEREVREAQRQLDSARQRVEVAGAAVRHADEQLRVTRAEFEHGAGGVASLLDAEAAWRGARLRHLQALYDVRVGVARLAFATGSPPAADPD